MRAWIAAAAVLALAAPAAAAPKGAQAKVAFDRGVAAYQKSDFAAASDALGTSFKLEPDVETLFAWAQSERQLEHCDKAVELFEKLLTFDLPAENKKVVRSKIDECKAIVASRQPVKQPEKQPEKQPVKQPEKQPEKQPVKQPEKQPEVASVDPPDQGPIRVDTPLREPEGSPWWKDPVGDGLVGLGAVGLAAGTYFLLSAQRASKDVKGGNLTTDKEYDAANDRVSSHGTIGVIAAITGGALVVGGIVRFATRGGGGKERTAVTGWLSPDGGGLAALGRF